MIFTDFVQIILEQSFLKIWHYAYYAYLYTSCRKCNGQVYKQTSMFRVSGYVSAMLSVFQHAFLLTGAEGPQGGGRELIAERERREILELEDTICSYY